MSDSSASAPPEARQFDLLVIGGGVNGCGIARDAAGRGLAVMLCEKGDLAQATSSASTKLFHGGLRYLEYFEFRLVREALIERETLLKAMPHIAWPLRFVLPIDPQLRNRNDKSALSKILRYAAPFLRGHRPAFLIRSGLFMYDHLGGREILPGTSTIKLRSHPAGRALQPRFAKAFEYSDCWVEDARLVVLNAKDAAARGAQVRTRTAFVGAQRSGRVWRARLRDERSGSEFSVRAKCIVNAGGPWVEEVLRGCGGGSGRSNVRLVRGSHIVTRRMFDHDQPYFFQLPDGRIMFALPYERDFTLIGTTDHDHGGDPADAECTAAERRYLLDAANRFFAAELTERDIAWTYSGVRPLYDDNASDATSATRDYVLTMHDEQGAAPLLNVFGGKLTTYRKLAEEALRKIGGYFPGMGGPWTAGAPLPGGDFPVDGFDELVARICSRFAFVDEQWARCLARRYGTEALDVYAGTASRADLGESFGADLYAREVQWLIDEEWAISVDDILWRRTKLGLRLDAEQQQALERWVDKACKPRAAEEAAALQAAG